MITVYTTTFNRGALLPRLYDSLRRQTVQSFRWLIIDDGSTDNTERIVKDWIKTSTFTIEYKFQSNQGKMAALNWAHDLIETVLCMNVDSDDYIVDNAIEIILGEWERIKLMPEVGGIVGLDTFRDGTIVGTKFPENRMISRFSDFFGKVAKGDKKFVYRTKVIQEFPKYPSIMNEKFPAPGYLYRLIDEKYKLLLVNEVLCVVEYLEDGITKNKVKQYCSSPNAFMFYRLERIRLSDSKLEAYVNAVHFVSSCIFARKNIQFNDNILLIFLALIPGVILHIYIRLILFYRS